MAVEVDSITRNKTCELVDRSAGVKHTRVCDTRMEACNTIHLGVKHTSVRDTKMEAYNTVHVPVESRLKISKAEDEPETHAPGVEQKVDIPTRADVRKMVDVTKALVAVSFNHKTHRNLSEEAKRRFYKNWTHSKNRWYGNE
ncbi:hypothetical protein YC2023_015784 [Brassica napus]